MRANLLSKGPLFFYLAIFLNVFVDLGHKIVIQNTVFKLYDGSTLILLTAIVNALILLPFILLLSPAGFVSDRFKKTSVMRASAWVVVFSCCLITYFYYQGWFWAAFSMTVILAAQSALYSPSKYGYIKEYFGKAKLGEVNGIVASLSIIAILIGNLIFSVFFETLFPSTAINESEVLQGIAPVGGFLIISSLLELIVMYRIPETNRDPAQQNFPWSKYLSGRLLVEDLSPLKRSRAIRLSVVGLAVFWAVGQVMLAAFPAHLKETLEITNTIVVQGVLACSGIGIALGSWFAGRFSRNYIETGLLPIGALGLAVGLLILPHLQSVSLSMVNFLFIGMMGGIFIVPLNALIQYFAEDNALGKTLAASNWVQNLNMLLFLAITVSFSLLGWSSKSLLELIAVVALAGSLYTVIELPQSLTRFILSCLISSHYRIKVQGMRNIPATGGVLLLGNHLSWIDWAVVQIACPRPVRFVMINTVYERWYLKWFFDLFGCVPIQAGAASRKSLEDIATALNQGEVICLFPEGVISRTGHLAEFKKGYERACEQVEGELAIVPFFLRGLWGSRFSRSSQRLKRTSAKGVARDIVVSFGTPEDKFLKAEILKQKVSKLSMESWKTYATSLAPIGEQWLETCKRRGNPVVLSDTMGSSFRSKQALTGTMLLARRIEKISPEQNIGLMLPTSAGGMLANMAVMVLGKTAVNLNFSASTEALRSAIEQSDIHTIYTSERFMKKLEARGIDLNIFKDQVTLVSLESFRASTTTLEKSTTLLKAFLLPTWLLKKLWCKNQNAEKNAVLLFSSGSEGEPKGVMLSHQSLMANVKQVAELLNMEDDDVMLANLPLFHAFGLTVTQFLPLLSRIPVVCHPDPTDVLPTAKVISSAQVTVMFGTSSFYRLYVRNRKIHPLMLRSLRLVVAGAEKLQEEVRTDFKLKFNKDILEGYGATETAPVASVNMPDTLSLDNWKVQRSQKLGSVGLPLPGTSVMIVDPDSFTPLAIGEAGMIMISGAQVMTGYLNNPEKTSTVLKEFEGTTWYVSGDKGYLDEDGFLFIQDRYSRFAKIGGEMVGLGTLEQAIRDAVENPDLELVAVNIPDEKKGEKIIVLSNLPLNKDLLREKLSAAGLNSLALPANYMTVDEIPTLGSGKRDFAKAKQAVLEAEDQD